MPEVRRLERVVVLLAGDVHVADGPAGPAADVLDAGEEGVVDVVDLGRRRGDGLDQRDERAVGGERPARPGGRGSLGRNRRGEDATMSAGHRRRRRGRGAGASKRGDLGEGRLLVRSGHVDPFIGRPSGNLRGVNVRFRASAESARSWRGTARHRPCSPRSGRGAPDSRAFVRGQHAVEVVRDELHELPAVDHAASSLR